LNTARIYAAASALHNYCIAPVIDDAPKGHDMLDDFDKLNEEDSPGGIYYSDGAVLAAITQLWEACDVAGN
jgi:hypothetical protein